MTERSLSSIQKRRTRGAIYVEVLVAIIPVLIFFFGLLQLAMLYSAKLIVRHAAWRAVRSAVVILEDDPVRFDGVVRGKLGYHESNGSAQSSGGAGDFLQSVADLLKVRLPLAELRGMMSSEAGPRLAAIRQSADMPLAVLAPMPGSLMQAFGLNGDELGDTSNATRFLLGMFLYNRAATMVTVLKDNGEVTDDVPATANVTVRVTYLYYCGMPIVNYFMCDSLMKLSGMDQLDDAATNYYQAVSRAGVDATRSIEGAQNLQQGVENAGRDLQTDLQLAADRAGALARDLQYAESPELLLPLMFSRAHFKMLRAEATLPNQGACYYPESSCMGTYTVKE